MAMWLYQLSQKRWSPERFRLEIWEHEKWNWPVGDKPPPLRDAPKAGDTVVFFYAPSGGRDAGFYGWAVVLEWFSESNAPLYFRPVAPSDYLKMRPWWGDDASELADRIRGKVKQGTLWRIPESLAEKIRSGIANWVASAS
jgi:hypothetical protein